MQFIQTGQFNIRALENLIKVDDPLARAQRVTLNRLNHLLGFIQELGEEVLMAYVEQLCTTYHDLLDGDIVDKHLNTEPLIVESDRLKAHPELTRNILNYHLR